MNNQTGNSIPIQPQLPRNRFAALNRDNKEAEKRNIRALIAGIAVASVLVFIIWATKPVFFLKKDTSGNPTTSLNWFTVLIVGLGAGAGTFGVAFVL